MCLPLENSPCIQLRVSSRFCRPSLRGVCTEYRYAIGIIIYDVHHLGTITPLHTDYKAGNEGRIRMNKPSESSQKKNMKNTDRDIHDGAAAA